MWVGRQLQTNKILQNMLKSTQADIVFGTGSWLNKPAPFFGLIPEGFQSKKK